MIAFIKSPKKSQGVGWQAGFLSMLPRIKRYAHRAFCDMRGEAKDDAVCEIIASCLCAYRRLHERNELHRAFASTLVRYAVKVYYRGRRVGTSQCSRDVYARAAQPGNTFEKQSIGISRGQRAAWMESLTDDHSTPIPEQVHFRIEFPRWLEIQTPRNRRIAETLSVGYTTAEVANKFQISPGRVSQLRKHFCESWQAFTDESAYA
jgi:hypothetical protein